MFDRLRLKLERRLEKLMGLAGDQPTHLPAVDRAAIEALRAQGNGLIAVGTLEEPEACFRTALTQAPHDTQVLICLGYVLKEQGHLAEARLPLRRAALGTGHHLAVYEAYYLLGQISEQQEDWGDATWKENGKWEHKTPDDLDDKARENWDGENGRPIPPPIV